jgi:hypothetical protein
MEEVTARFGLQNAENVKIKERLDRLERGSAVMLPLHVFVAHECLRHSTFNALRDLTTLGKRAKGGVADLPAALVDVLDKPRVKAVEGFGKGWSESRAVLSG